MKKYYASEVVDSINKQILDTLLDEANHTLSDHAARECTRQTLFTLAKAMADFSPEDAIRVYALVDRFCPFIK